MPGRNFLFVPGPTNVPERILRAMNRAMEDHRSSAFPELATGLFRDLRKVFKTTTGQAFIFPATGTGGWEAALVNTLSPGDRVLAPRYGQFSHLWIELAQRHGLRVDIIDVEWGEGAPSDRIGEILAQDTQREIKGILLVHNETATRVTSDVAAVRSAIDAAQHPALLYVDGVSSIGSIDFRMDEWKVDLAITGSQKGLMRPAGLGLVCASPKALAAREHAKCPRAASALGLAHTSPSPAGSIRPFCDPVMARSTFHSSMRKSMEPMELTPSTYSRAGCCAASIALRTAATSLVTPVAVSLWTRRIPLISRCVSCARISPMRSDGAPSPHSTSMMSTRKPCRWASSIHRWLNWP